MTVLLISQDLDPTADEVVLALGERGVPVFRIDRSWFPQRLTLEASFHALSGCHANHPDRVAALSKPNEIALADRCGLSVPPTIVSNGPAHVRAFCTDSGAAVRKLFSCSVADPVGPAMVGHTRLVTEEDLAEVDPVALTAHH